MSNRIDQERVRRLYEDHSPGLLAYACSFTSSFAAAEDALHQVFERLQRGAPETSVDDGGDAGRRRPPRLRRF